MVSRNFNRGGIGEHVFSAMVKGEKPKGEEIGLRESIRRTIGGNRRYQTMKSRPYTRVPTLWPFCRGQIAPL